MRLSKFYLITLFALSAFLFYSCESISDSAPMQQEIETQRFDNQSDAQTKVDVCHYDAELDAYELITIADPAVDAHIKHGDAQPGDAVPTMEGFEFDETCTPQPVGVEMTACFQQILSDSPYNTISELNVENLSWSSITEEGSYLSIQAPLDDGSMILRVVDRSFYSSNSTLGYQELFCSLTFPGGVQEGDWIFDGGTTDFSSTIFDYAENIGENISYLEYLLSL